MHIEMTVNGKRHEADVEPRLLLVDLLRDTFGLTGTKVGCEDGQCGTCTILLDGVSLKSCLMLAVQADGANIQTIEGIAHNEKLNSLQEGFWEKNGVQCGFCTPGMVMSITDLLQRNATPDEAEIRTWLDGNLCRCTGYQHVVEAVQHAVQKNNSPVKMIVDTPLKQVFEDRVKLLMAGDVDRLVDEHYNEDAVLVSFDFVVRGRDALKEHFRNFVKWVALKEVVSTESFVETQDSYFYEATAVTNYGVGRVYDAYYLTDGKIAYHFTGMIT
ncbi:2Fe-2S iron-sulfur cluster-binding protein [Gemmatimonadota bacterium]